METERITLWERFKLAYELIRSQTIILITDRTGVVSIEGIGSNVRSVMLLTAQRGMLEEIRNNLDLLISTYDEATESVLKETPKKQNKRKPSAQRTSRTKANKE